MEYIDYYKTLNIEQDCPQAKIKQAYRQLARKYHPDINKDPGAEEKFKEIGEAYEVLNDPEKRAAYDKFGHNWQQGQDFTPPSDWDAGFEFSGSGMGRAEQAGFSDFFSELFGSRQFNQGQNQSFSMQGEDHHAHIVITLAEAWHGAKRTFTLTKPEINTQGQFVNKQHTITVTIPKGITAGHKIRLKGQGMSGHGKGKHGDLYLEISFQENPLYSSIKRDILITLPITPWEAALGGKIACPTLGGTVNLDIPTNSQSGHKLRLKGRGLCSTSHSGDQIVTLKIVIPRAITDEEKEVYRTMAKIMPMDPRQNMKG